MNLANRISVFRFLLIPVFMLCLLYYTPETDYLRFCAFGVFAVAVISDALDGYIARSRNQITKLGTYLDPLADKFLLSTAFIALVVLDNLNFAIQLPVWVTIIVISRDLVIIVGSLIVYLIDHRVTFLPSRLGKICTFFQMMTVAGILLQVSFSIFIWNIAVFFTIISGMHYLRKGGKLLNANASVQ